MIYNGHPLLNWAMELHYIPHPSKPFTSAIRLKACRHHPYVSHQIVSYVTYGCSCFKIPSRLVSLYLVCISSHILPGVKSGTSLGHHAWLGPNKWWVQKAMALSGNVLSWWLRNVIGFGKEGSLLQIVLEVHSLRVPYCRREAQ